MKITGIIAEYNPFHNGHLHQIMQARKNTNADYIVIAMSGNYTQRGIPAIIDKYTRAQMALEHGADLVIELPPIFSSASAEFFAHAGISLFDHCGIVDYLSFGCETPQIEHFRTISTLLSEENEALSSSIQLYLKKGLSYPVARYKAFLDIFHPLNEDLPIYEKILSSSNNILALEYLKAIQKRHSSLITSPVKREGNDYNQKSLSGAFSSATAIRKNMLGKNHEFSYALPKDVHRMLCDYEKDTGFLEENMFSEMLFYQLLTNQNQGYSNFFDCNQDLSNKISKNLQNFVSFHDFCDKLKSKDVTYTRIQRILLHILLNQTYEDFAQAQSLDYVPYLKLLGFRKDATGLLSNLKQNASVPILTKVSSAKQILDAPSYAFFEKSMFADQLYYSMQGMNAKKQIRSEFERSPIIIS